MMSDPQTRKLSHYFTHSKRKGRPGLPLASVTMNDGLVLREDMDRKMDTSLSAEEHSLVEPGDIAYNMMRMWQGAFGLASAPVNVSPAYVVMRAKPTLDPRFAAHWLKSDRALYLLWAFSYGLTDDRLRLYPKEFLQIPVQWPDIAEQRRIAAVLDVWDEAIATCKLLVESKRKLAAQLSRAVFPLLRDLDDLSGLIKFRIRDYAKIIRGVAYNPTSDTAETGIGILTAAHVQDGGIYLAPEWVNVTEQSVSDQQILRLGDFLVAMSNGSKALVGKAALVREPLAHSLAAGAFCSTIRPKDKEARRLLDHALASVRYKELLHVELAGSAIGNLSDSQLRDFEFYWSGETEKLDALDASNQATRLAENHLSLLAAQKRAMMQRLLTGQWPVPESIDALLPAASEVVA